MRIDLLLILALFSACSSMKDSPKYQLSDGQYEFKQPGGKYKPAFITIKEDSLRIFLNEKPREVFTPPPNVDQYFLKRSFDVDVITIPFKYRPSTSNLPRQLTTDFNGNVFIGFRGDRFALRFEETPAGWIQTHKHRALSVGVFGGLGATSVTPWTTNYQTTDEYSGVVLSRGLAFMVGINKLTVGIGVGWDFLTDRDKDIWIYQNTAWYGLTLGLNLN
jgi:hypothetical protein